MEDDRLLDFIRRVILDMILSRESKSLESFMTAYNREIKDDKYLGLVSKFPYRGPWRVGDDMGFQVAL